MSVQRALWVAAVVFLAGCRNGEDNRSQGIPQNPETRSGSVDPLRQDGPSPENSLRIFRTNEQTRLDTAYASLEKRLDSLWGDSLNVASPNRALYRRILEEARTVRDKTKVYLDELRVGPEGITPQIWEEIRARADLSLDSLRRLFISADSTRKLRSDGRTK